MRFYFKLVLLAALGVASQALIERHEGDLDEGIFAVRMLAARVSGESAASEHCINAADALKRRQWARADRRGRDLNATTRPAVERAASIEDELELFPCRAAR